MVKELTTILCNQKVDFSALLGSSLHDTAFRAATEFGNDSVYIFVKVLKSELRKYQIKTQFNPDSTLYIQTYDSKSEWKKMIAFEAPQ